MSEFEPTKTQPGVGRDLFTLIDPEAIPYPETDSWSLNYAAETLRTGGQEMASITEDMETTWQGLQEHYTAPEAETLFAAVGPVATTGEDLEDDLATVATALEDLAEAAAQARRTLNNLRIQAQSFHREHSDKDVWWLGHDDEADTLAIVENLRLKTDVNTAWARFTTAEVDCANAISTIYGAATFTSPEDATGAEGELVYGTPDSEGHMPEFGADFATVHMGANSFAHWFAQNVDPAGADFDNSLGQAAYDSLVVGVVWGTASGFMGKSGLWHQEHGLGLTQYDRERNRELAGFDAAKDLAPLLGLYGQDGWLWDPRQDDSTENMSGTPGSATSAMVGARRGKTILPGPSVMRTRSTQGATVRSTLPSSSGPRRSSSARPSSARAPAAVAAPAQRPQTPPPRVPAPVRARGAARLWGPEVTGSGPRRPAPPHPRTCPAPGDRPPIGSTRPSKTSRAPTSPPHPPALTRHRRARHHTRPARTPPTRALLPRPPRRRAAPATRTRAVRPGDPRTRVEERKPHGATDTSLDPAMATSKAARTPRPHPSPAEAATHLVTAAVPAHRAGKDAEERRIPLDLVASRRGRGTRMDTGTTRTGRATSRGTTRTKTANREVATTKAARDRKPRPAAVVVAATTAKAHHPPPAETTPGTTAPTTRDAVTGTMRGTGRATKVPRRFRMRSWTGSPGRLTTLKKVYVRQG